MHRFALLLPVACAFACGDATQPTPPHSTPVARPSFGVVVPHGAPAFTTCTEGQGNVEVEPHFSNPAVPEPVFTDPDTTVDANLPNRCGSLVFNNRTRVATTVYATQSDPGENPWKYWWRRARYGDNGTGVLTEVRKVSVGPDTLDAAVVELPLSAQYDAIGTPGDVQLLLSAAPVDGGGTWTFVVLRGGTPTAVRARAEEVRRALR